MKKLTFLFAISILSFSYVNALSLKDGYKLALENDMDSKVNENNLKNIEYDQDIADAMYYPTVDFNANITTTKRTEDQKTPGSSGSSTKSDEYKFEVRQPLFDGFESKYEKELQKNRYKSAVYYLQESKNTLAASYVQSYINVLRDKDLLAASNESVSISEDMLKKVYKKIKLGYGTKLEFSEVKGNLAESRVNVDTQRINLRESIEGLKYYIQEDFDSSELSKPTSFVELPKNLDEAVKTALNENPTINVAKANLAVSIAQEKQAYKDYYPTVDFVGVYNLDNSVHTEADQEYNEYSLGVQLNYNLYNGGKDSANIKKALQDIKEKKFLIKKSQYQIKNRVRLAWNSYKLNRDKNRRLKQYIVVKKDIFEASLKEFDLGLKDLNTVLEYYIDYVDVKKDLISNTYDLLYAKYNLLSTLGKLPAALSGKLPLIKDTVEDIDDLDDSDVLKKPEYNYDDNLQMEQNKYEIIKPQEKTQKQEEQNNYEPLIRRSAYTANTYIEEHKINTSESFKSRFLSAPKGKYTINLALAYSDANAQKFLDRYSLNDKAFFFTFGKDRKYRKIMMGIYDSFEDAQRAIDEMPSSLRSNKPVVESIVEKQNLYVKYNGKKNEPKKDEYIAKSRPAQIKKVSFVSYEKSDDKTIYGSFKEKFLSASDDKYTINLAYTTSFDSAERFLDNHNIRNSAFHFSFGQTKKYEKIMYGVFDSRSEAKKAIKALDESLKRNQPRVESITIKQKLYKKYHLSSDNTI